MVCGKNNVYDYDDMISMILKKFKKNACTGMFKE